MTPLAFTLGLLVGIFFGGLVMAVVSADRIKTAENKCNTEIMKYIKQNISLRIEVDSYKEKLGGFLNGQKS